MAKERITFFIDLDDLEFIEKQMDGRPRSLIINRAIKYYRRALERSKACEAIADVGKENN